MPWTNTFRWSNLLHTEFIVRFLINDPFFTLSMVSSMIWDYIEKSEFFSVTFSWFMTLLLSSMVLCLTSSEESKLCLCLSLPTAALSSSVSNIVLLKKGLFKKSKSLLANIYVPPLFKCKPSLHKTSLVILSLLANWNFFCTHHVRGH